MRKVNQEFSFLRLGVARCGECGEALWREHDTWQCLTCGQPDAGHEWWESVVKPGCVRCGEPDCDGRCDRRPPCRS